MTALMMPTRMFISSTAPNVGHHRPLTSWKDRPSAATGLRPSDSSAGKLTVHAIARSPASVPDSAEDQIERRGAADVTVIPTAEYGGGSCPGPEAGQVPLSEARGCSHAGEVHPVVSGPGHRVHLRHARAGDRAGPRILPIHLDLPEAAAHHRHAIVPLATADGEQVAGD